MTLYLLDSDGVLMLAPHLVDAACDADHALKCSLNHLVTLLHGVVVVDDVLRRHPSTLNSPASTTFRHKVTFLPRDCSEAA